MEIIHNNNFWVGMLIFSLIFFCISLVYVLDLAFSEKEMIKRNKKLKYMNNLYSSNTKDDENDDENLIYCKECGGLVDLNSNYCKFCGKKIF